MRSRSIALLTILLTLLVCITSVLSQDSSELPQAPTPLRVFAITNELVIILFCAILIFCWAWQIFMVRRRVEDLDDSGAKETFLYSAVVPGWLTPTRWTFFSTVFLLPVGLSLLSQVFPLSNDPYMPALAYRFAVAVFIIMITLEISYLYNLANEEWHSMLIAALTIDLIAFVGFLLLREPKGDLDTITWLMFIFYGLSGILSLVASFVTLYHARMYDKFTRGEFSQEPNSQVDAEGTSNEEQNPSAKC